MPTVKALSLHQPWATWIAEGIKTVETRMWGTRYRGILLICASLHGSHRNGNDRFVFAPKAPGQRPGRLALREYPAGCATALTLLVNVTPMRPHHEAAACCECESGRFAWELMDIMPLPPLIVSGRQGLFNVDIEDALVREFWERRSERMRGA